MPAQPIESHVHTANASNAGVSLYDARPFFEKALRYGVQNSLIDEHKFEAICTEAPKGMVQIARYFGSEFLRPELEKAKDRMVNLASLQLENATSGDLHEAALLLREHSFLSRSKGGSDMLKALIAMPQTSHFGMNERKGFTDDHIPQLAKWALRSLADYQAELQQRSDAAKVIDAAVWMADALGMAEADLQDAGPDAQAVIRTALLARAVGLRKMPDWVAFDAMVVALRKKHGKTPSTLAAAVRKTWPGQLPTEFEPVVVGALESLQTDAAKILDASLPTRKLFGQTPAFLGRYFWLEDALSEVDNFDRATSAAWAKATAGHSDDSSLLTLFVTLAAGAPAKTLLTEKTALSMLRKIRKTGFHPERASQYIAQHAPAHQMDDCNRLWTDFVAEAQATLISDFDHTLQDALALIERNCNIT